MNKIFITLTFLLLSGCITKDYKGGVPIRAISYEQIKTARTKEDIYNILGSPAWINETGLEKWFYYTSEGKIFAFLDPKFTKYEIIVITFGENNLVQNIKVKDLKNSKFSYNTKDYTPLPSEIKLSFFEELFGNIGRFKQAGMGK